VRRERALRLLPAVSDEALPHWCALAKDEARLLHDGWGQYHYRALMNLAIKYGISEGQQRVKRGLGWYTSGWGALPWDSLPVEPC
jgi:hypothetical protein